MNFSDISMVQLGSVRFAFGSRYFSWIRFPLQIFPPTMWGGFFAHRLFCLVECSWTFHPPTRCELVVGRVVDLRLTYVRCSVPFMPAPCQRCSARENTVWTQALSCVIFYKVINVEGWYHNSNNFKPSKNAFQKLQGHKHFHYLLWCEKRLFITNRAASDQVQL